MHKLLAEFFREKIDTHLNFESFTRYSRSYTEVIYHLVRSEEWDILRGLLCNVVFIRQFYLLKMGYQLLLDLQLAVETTPEIVRNEIYEYRNFVNANHYLFRDLTLSTQSDFVLQQALNQLDSTSPAKFAKAQIAAGKYTLPLIRLANKPEKSTFKNLMFKVRNSWYDLNNDSNKDRVRTCDITMDGKLIVSGAEDSRVKIWDEKGNLLHTINTFSDIIQSIKFSNDGKLILVAAKDGEIKIFEVTTKQEISSFSKESCLYCTFTPSGKQFLYTQTLNVDLKSANNLEIRLCDTETGELIQTFIGHTEVINQAVFSVDGKYIYTASDDQTTKQFEINSAKLVKTFNGHSAEVKTVGISPDGKLLVTGSVDRHIKIWSIETGECTRTFIGHTNVINNVNFSIDGKWIFSTARDATTRIWNIENGQILAAIPDSERMCMTKNKLVTFGATTFNIAIYDIVTEK